MIWKTWKKSIQAENVGVVVTHPNSLCKIKPLIRLTGL